jgi:uncharacterized repeat protein (TIGR03803 family)
MKTWRIRHLMAALALLAVADCNIWARNPSSAGTSPFKTIHLFTGNAGGSAPNGITADANGILYGTTQSDGNCSTCGIIYRLKPPPSGTTRWSFDTLHKFVLSKDGIKPVGPLTVYQGKLYGTASAGGDALCNCGVVFAIGADGSGFAVLHTFKKQLLGATPLAGVLIDTDGTLYGSTSTGGANGAGVIFKLGAGGGYAVLHDFDGTVGSGPQGDLVFGGDGAIYGTQFNGGKFNQGAIFRITKAGAYTVLYDFEGTTQPGPSTDGAMPDGRLAVGTDGTIYGTTSSGGGPSGLGTAWSIKKAGGQWAYKQLRMFSSSEATVPHSGLILGGDDSLYGTGSTGGAHQAGALFQLLPPSNGHRAYRTLHSFKSVDSHGDTPQSPIVLLDGVIYGSTLLGGDVNSSACSAGCGTVFSDTP